MDDKALRAASLQVQLLSSIVDKTANRDLDRSLEACNAGISGLQFGVLRLLSRQSFTVSELSHRLQRAPATLVPVVDALVRKGLATRQRDPRDRRRTPLTLTEDGARRIAELRALWISKTLLSAMSALRAEDARQLAALLEKLVGHLPQGEEKISRALSSLRWAGQEPDTIPPTRLNPAEPSL